MMDDLLFLKHREVSLESYRLDMVRKNNTVEIEKIDKLLIALRKNIRSKENK